MFHEVYFMTSAGKLCPLCCPLAEPQDVMFSKGLEGADQEGLAGREVLWGLVPRVKYSGFLLVIAVPIILCVVHSPAPGPLHGATHLRAGLPHLCSTLHHVVL